MNQALDGDSAVPAHLGAPLTEVDRELAPASQSDSDVWRSEVAARLARYRTRRKPRAPRYPSLLLPFDSSDNWSRSAPANATAPSEDHFPPQQPEIRQEVSSGASISPRFSSDFSFDFPSDVPPQPPEHQPSPPTQPEPEPSAKIIEFPRSAAIPVFHASLLADPILDRPRIVEAPEVVLPPPALGGILIEPVPPALSDPRAGRESRIQSASVPRRLLATSVDALILAVALSAFAAIFLRFNPARGPIPLLAGAAALIAVLLWMVYQFAFVVYTGSTPGLRAARLTLANLDSSAVPHPMRRWRVLASFLSAFSAGLGYLWCFVDQDSLCWHDRITRTHLRRAGMSQPAKPLV
ncbi:MAG: RDD family protein [Terriglobales bacterium]